MKMSLLFGPVVAEPICRSLPLILHRRYPSSLAKGDDTLLGSLSSPLAREDGSVFNQSYHKIESDNERTTSNLERIKSEVVSCWKTVFHRIIEISVSDMVRTASDIDISESDMDREVSELHSCINDISSCSCITRYLLTCYNPNLSILTDIKHQLSLAESTLRVVSPHMLKLVKKALGKSSKNDSFNAMRTLMKFKISLNIVKIEIMEIQMLCLRETEIMTVGNPAFMRDIYLDDATNLFPKIHDLILIPNLRRCSRFVIILFKSYPDLPESLGVTVLAKKHNTMHEKVYSEQRTTLLKVERKNIQFCLFLHDSCFQEITKDIACYTGIEEKSSLCKLSQKYFDLLNEAVNVVRKNEVGSSFEKMSLNQRESNRKQIESLVRDFFKNEKKLDSDNPVHDKNHVLKRGVSGKEDHSEDDQQEPQGLLDVIPEIFAHVEIRPLEIVAFPATQQRVLEPFLNKFTSPESTPSKHDTMAVEFLRLCTMHDYPSTNGPSLLRLAENGFYYDGNGTELICFSCGVKIRNWKYDDIPSEIHQKMSANCRFLMESGDGNIPVPRMDIHEELASSGQPAQVISGVEADGPRTAAAEPPNNTAVLTSADSAQGHSKTPPRVMVIKHPEYADRSKRLASYKTFPRHMKQHPADMTDAGFYYAGFGDCCRCYHCGVGLRNWDPEDNPWIEHARWSADCPYIFEMKGQAFIDLVQEAARAAEMADDDNENEDDARSTEEKSAPFPASSTAANDSAQISQTPTELSSNSIENNVVKTSEATISQGTPVDKAPVAVMPDPKIIKAPLRSPAAQTLVHEEKIKPRFVMEAIDELVKKEGWTAFNIENIRKYLKIQEDGRKSAHSASAADPNVLKQENKELKDLTICKICLDEKVSIVFLPCGHLVSCPQCAPALTKCPICRKVIKGTVRTNLVEKNHGIAKKS